MLLSEPMFIAIGDVVGGEQSLDITTFHCGINILGQNDNPVAK